MRTRTVLPLALSLVAWAGAARAGDHERAVRLFRQGQALAAQGRCAEAIPKLTDTLAIEPSVGALLNLGACEERTHAPEPAWKHFREAEALAHRLGDDREPFARSHAEALEPLLPKLVVVAPGAAARLTIRVDGEALPPSAWGTPRAVVTGPHVVTAEEPGRPPWQQTVVTAGQATSTVTIPGSSPAPHPPEHAAPHGSTRRTIGLVVGATGAAGLVLGSVFGGVAIARKSDAASLASGPSQAAFDAAKADATAWAAASTVAFVVSGVAIAAGAVIWLTAPSERTAVALVPTAGGLALRGAF
jgi:hypothetical protein